MRLEWRSVWPIVRGWYLAAGAVVTAIYLAAGDWRGSMYWAGIILVAATVMAFRRHRTMRAGKRTYRDLLAAKLWSFSWSAQAFWPGVR